MRERRLGCRKTAGALCRVGIEVVPSVAKRSGIPFGAYSNPGEHLIGRKIMRLTYSMISSMKMLRVSQISRTQDYNATLHDQDKDATGYSPGNDISNLEYHLQCF